MRNGIVLVLAMAGLPLAAQPAMAAEIHLNPGDNVAVALAAADPGDVIILHAGEPDETYGRTVINNVHGTAGAWITVRGADGEPRPKFYRSPAVSANNIIDISNCSYLALIGLEITGGATGSDGIKFTANTSSHDILLEDLYIHNVGGGGINASGIIELYNLTVRRCEIAFTGANGEGFYLGRHGDPGNPQVHDSLIEQCYIHDMGGNQGDGIELKHGCYRVVVQDNVLRVANGYPPITSWGTYKNDPSFNNIVRRNFIYGGTDAGIHVTGEIDIENNIVVNSLGRGIHCRSRDFDGVMRDTRIVNNTIYVAGGDALNLSGWGSGTGLVLANNAIYQDQPGRTAVNAVGGLAAATVAGNYYYGSSNANVPGLIAGPAPADAFINPSTSLATVDLYPKPGSVLIDNGAAADAPADGFNGLSRPFGPAPDVGAYEVHYGDANPGWHLALGFKDIDAAIIPGDVDRDGEVSVLDVTDVVNAFGTTPADPGWLPEADLDGDGEISVLDVITVVGHFGQSV